MASAFFRKLSLSAEQSWHQNSGANLRDVIRLLNMHASAGGCGKDARNLHRTFSRNCGENLNGVHGHGSPTMGSDPSAKRFVVKGSVQARGLTPPLPEIS